MKIGIIGKGMVGSALGYGLGQTGHVVKYGHRDPKEPVKNAVEWAEVVILAVPHDSVHDAVKNFGSSANGKVVIDVTNVLSKTGELALGFTTSGAEELQKLIPKARVVKAFNTVFAKNQSSGHIGDAQLTAFIAGDDASAKKTVMQLTKDLGFDPVDCGPLKAARYLEPMAMLIIDLGFRQKMGVDIGYKLLKK